MGMTRAGRQAIKIVAEIDTASTIEVRVTNISFLEKQPIGELAAKFTKSAQDSIAAKNATV